MIMKKLLTLCAAICAAATLFAAERVVWEGNKAISWNQDVYAGEQFETPEGTFADLKKDEVIKVTVIAKIDEPQYVMTYKAGDSWEWTDLPTDIADGLMTYTVASDEIAGFIAQRGLIFRGQGYDMTKIAIVSEDAPVDPQPEKEEVVLFEGEKVLGASGGDNLGIAADKFASLAAKDSIVVTITDMTDTYCQLNIAANTGWVVVPGTNWESLNAVGRYAYVIADADLVTAIKDGGITIQGKLCTITKVTLSPYVEPGDDPQPEDKPYVFTTVWTGDVAISWNQEVYAGSEMDTYNVQQDMLAGLAKDDSIKIYYADAIDEAQFALTYKAGSEWSWTDLAIAQHIGFFAYKVASDEIAQDIADRGLIIRGQGYHAIRIEIGKPDTSTGIGAAITTTPARKIIENGQVLIIKDGVRYNILGAVVR